MAKKVVEKTNTAAKSAKNQNTLVTFLLDRTGSMQSIKDDTIGAFNEYLSTLQKASSTIDFTFVLFDSNEIEKRYVAVPVKKVPALTDSTYRLGAMTPLIDAAYKTIKAVEEAVKATSGKPKVVICIQTDGQENASREYTWDQLADLIKEKTAAGWQFNFMGAGIDAYQQGSRMGISTANTVSYNSSDRRATRAVFGASAMNTMGFASGARASTGYDVGQKMAAGDKFDPGNKPASLSRPTLRRKIVDDIKL